MERAKKADTKKDAAKTTAPVPETPEQAEDTAPVPETPEQAEDTAPVPETPEQAEDTAAAPEPDMFANLPNPCVYCGPTVRGVARQYTTYQGGIPDTLRNFIKEHRSARQLIVSTAQFPAMRRRLDTPGTAEANLYKAVKAEL